MKIILFKVFKCKKLKMVAVQPFLLPACDMYKKVHICFVNANYALQYLITPKFDLDATGT